MWTHTGDGRTHSLCRRSPVPTAFSRPFARAITRACCLPCASAVVTVAGAPETAAQLHQPRYSYSSTNGNLHAPNTLLPPKQTSSRRQRIVRQARDDHTANANGRRACREGKCSRKCCSHFKSKTKHASSVARWSQKSRSSSCAGCQTPGTRRRPCCIGRKQAHARQTTGNQLHASGRAG